MVRPCSARWESGAIFFQRTFVIFLLKEKSRGTSTGQQAPVRCFWPLEYFHCLDDTPAGFAFYQSISRTSVWVRKCIIHEILNCIASKAMVKYDHNEVQDSIRENPKFSPFFDDCIGAIDGMHIPAVVPEELQLAFRNRKGYRCQNLLGVVNFDMTFQFVLC
jgi:hypothetical protein